MNDAPRFTDKKPVGCNTDAKLMMSKMPSRNNAVCSVTDFMKENASLMWRCTPRILGCLERLI